MFFENGMGGVSQLIYTLSLKVQDSWLIYLYVYLLVLPPKNQPTLSTSIAHCNINVADEYNNFKMV